MNDEDRTMFGIKICAYQMWLATISWHFRVHCVFEHSSVNKIMSRTFGSVSVKTSNGKFASDGGNFGRWGVEYGRKPLKAINILILASKQDNIRFINRDWIRGTDNIKWISLVCSHVWHSPTLLLAHEHQMQHHYYQINRISVWRL